MLFNFWKCRSINNIFLVDNVHINVCSFWLVGWLDGCLAGSNRNKDLTDSTLDPFFTSIAEIYQTPICHKEQKGRTILLKNAI